MADPTSVPATETPVFTAADDAFHFDVMSDRWWETETSWFSFHHAERRLGGWFYSMIRPNIGTVAGGAWVWDDTAVPTPSPYFFEDDPAVLGAPFLVMERVPGECPSPWGGEGRRFYESAAARGVLGPSFTDTLVALHTLD